MKTYAMVFRTSDGAVLNPQTRAWEDYDPERYAQYAMPHAETITAEPETIEAPAETNPPKDDTKPAEKETPEDIEKRARKPPADGPCKGCGQDRPLNRLMLCYKCWTYKQLHEQTGGKWLPGDPHPSHCGCDGPGGCATKNQGN